MPYSDPSLTFNGQYAVILGHPTIDGLRLALTVQASTYGTESNADEAMQDLMDAMSAAGWLVYNGRKTLSGTQDISLTA